jgi:hypothetical protein
MIRFSVPRVAVAGSDLKAKALIEAARGVEVADGKHQVV